MPRIITLTPNPALDFSFEAEKVEPNQKLRCSNPRVDAGGGGVNVARAALRLSAQTLAIFTTGGLHGATLKEAVARENVPVRIVPVGGETRPAFHVRETYSGDEFRFNFPGAEMSDGEASLFLAALEEGLGIAEDLGVQRVRHFLAAGRLVDQRLVGIDLNKEGVEVEVVEMGRAAADLDEQVGPADGLIQ